MQIELPRLPRTVRINHHKRFPWNPCPSFNRPKEEHLPGHERYGGSFLLVHNCIHGYSGNLQDGRGIVLSRKHKDILPWRRWDNLELPDYGIPKALSMCNKAS